MRDLTQGCPSWNRADSKKLKFSTTELRNLALQTHCKKRPPISTPLQPLTSRVVGKEKRLFFEIHSSPWQSLVWLRGPGASHLLGLSFKRFSLFSAPPSRVDLVLSRLLVVFGCVCHSQSPLKKCRLSTAVSLGSRGPRKAFWFSRVVPAREERLGLRMRFRLPTPGRRTTAVRGRP